jgi:hypothetical protein
MACHGFIIINLFVALVDSTHITVGHERGKKEKKNIPVGSPHPETATISVKLVYLHWSFAV